MTQPTEQDRAASAIDEKLSRGIDRWQACDPILMATQSQAALIFAFRDMKNDILKLYAEAERLQSRVGELEQERDGLAAKLEALTNPKPTNCWKCSDEYEIKLTECPHCGAANANVNWDLAKDQIEREGEV